MAASTWPHWELQLLNTAGLPTTDRNATWLKNWQEYERTTCERNPVNTSRTAPGSSRCKRLPNGKWARAYASRDSAAFAFAQQLNLTDFPVLRKAFAGGDPNMDADTVGITRELQLWGSVGWREQYALSEGVAIYVPSDTAASNAESNVSGAWTALHRVLEHEGTLTIAELHRSSAALRRIERRLRRA